MKPVKVVSIALAIALILALASLVVAVIRSDWITGVIAGAATVLSLVLIGILRRQKHSL